MKRTDNGGDIEDQLGMKSGASRARRRRRHWYTLAMVGALAGSSFLYGAEPPPELTLSNFFSTGWNESWSKFPRGEGTPDMSLLRVQTNILGQLLRTDFASQRSLAGAATRSADSLTESLEYAVNRRLLLALVGNYRWIDSRLGDDHEGGALGAFARLQLIETTGFSLASTFRVGLPNHDLGERDTVYSFSLAGWHDLAPLGLSRTGLYWHVQEENYFGRHAPGARRNDLTYDLSLAKSWTQPEAVLGNFTTLLEAYARTDLDGPDRGGTLVTLTPGLRATIAHRHILMAGVEFPVTEPRPFDHIFRVSYLLNF